MRGSIFSMVGCAAPFRCGKSCESTRARVVSLTFFPLQARDYLVPDWLSMALWCDDSKRKRAGPQLVRITILSQQIVVVVVFFKL